MDKDVTHLLDDIPWCFAMSLFELLGQHIHGFSDNLNIVDGGMEEHFVRHQMFFGQSMGVVFDTLNGRKDVA